MDDDVQQTAGNRKPTTDNKQKTMDDDVQLTAGNRAIDNGQQTTTDNR
jgi:hypothetical protein